MGIEHVVLGFLSQEPMSGYAIKKRIVEAPFFQSTANNNQIYKALLGLKDRGFAAVRLEEKDRGVSSKIYSITPVGRLELLTWVKSLHEPSEFISQFHQRLAFAHNLTDFEIKTLFSTHETELAAQIANAKELLKRFETTARATNRDERIYRQSWSRIFLHRVQVFELELQWLKQTQQALTRTEKKGRA